MKPISKLLVLFGTAAFCLQAAAQDNTVPGWLEKDFGELTALFEGRWDSDRHAFFAEAAGMDLDQVAPRQHIEIVPATLAAGEELSAGQAVFQATRSVDGEPPATLIHTFTIDSDRQAIRQSVSTSGGVLAPTPMDCHVLWHRQGAQFQGKAEGVGCDALFPRPAEGGPLEATLTLSENDFWVTSSRGNNTIEARLRRARPFECWTAILRGAEHGDSGEGMRDWDFRRGVKLHDQGGEAELMSDEPEPRRIRLRLRNVDWPYGTNRPSLTLYVMEGDSDRAVSYAWTEGGADRIGINLRWLQASCTYTPPVNDE
ncbi:MAG: hypothetical protein QNI84_00275 [Henriciella sp.]|nr:hypothetical protein [Henriciella sp.]